MTPSIAGDAEASPFGVSAASPAAFRGAARDAALAGLSAGPVSASDRSFAPAIPARWPAGLLLVVQAIALLVVVPATASLQFAAFTVPGLFGSSSASLVPLASLLGLVGAAGLFLRLRSAWPLAMAAQGLVLLTGLGAVFADRPSVAYPLLLGTVCLVLYLNSTAVRQDLEEVGFGRSGEPAGDA